MGNLPSVKIYFENGALGSVSPSDDGVVGLVCSGAAAGTGAEKIELGTAYLLTSLADLEKRGVTSAESGDNAMLYRTVKEFYSEAPNGTKLWLMVVGNDVTQSAIVDKAGEKAYAKSLIVAAKGDINLIAVKTSSAGKTAGENGIAEDTYAAVAKAQALAEDFAAEEMYAPCMVLLEGLSYNGEAGSLKKLAEMDCNRVAVLIGDTFSDSKGAAVGLLAGRIASIPVQRSIARVKSGAVGSTEMYIGAEKAENGNPDTISGSGYICPRTFVGKAGYFWSDDKLATAVSDDYALIPRRRVIDKAYRIAYQTLINELGEEIPVTSDGNIPAATCKSIQNMVETAVINSMTNEGNLGIDPEDPNDTGVECYIDPAQNIVADSKLKVQLRVRPYGYAKYIEVFLGFQAVKSTK